MLAKLLVILVTWPLAPSPDINAVVATMGTVDAYYAAQSYGRFVTQSNVVGPYTVSLDASSDRFAVAREAQAAALADGVDLSLYDWGGTVGSACRRCVYLSQSNWGGVGNFSGTWIGTTNPQWSLVAHELGHSQLNLAHAHGLVCDDDEPTWNERGDVCTVWEYGDTLDVMGEGFGEFGVAIKRSLGWLDLDQVITVTASGDYVLTPLETAGGLKMLVLIGGSKQAPKYYALEYRTRTSGGFVYGPYANGVMVRRGTSLLRMSPPDPASPYYTYTGTIDTPAMTLGLPFCAEGEKVEATVIALDSASAVVRVKLGKC